MRRRLGGAFSLMLLALPPFTARAQRSATNDTTAMMTAAAALVRSRYSPGPTTIDVDSAASDARAQAQTIAKALHAEAGKPNRVCSGSTPDTCHLVGARVALGVMRPVVHGDTAQVTVCVWEETASRRQPIYGAELVVTLLWNGDA